MKKRKAMKEFINVELTEQIRSKLITGDFIVASKMMEITTDNVRIRFTRGKRDAIDCLQKIIINRSQLITKYKKNQ